MNERRRGTTFALAFLALLAACSQSAGGGFSIFQGDGAPVSDDVGFPECLAIAGGRIYFTDEGSDDQPAGVRSSPLAGGTVTLHAGFQGDSRALVTDGSAIWWIETSGDKGVVKRVSAAAGASPTVVADGLAEPGALAINAASVFYVEQASGAIWRAASSTARGSPPAPATRSSLPHGRKGRP
jgi:sugar lactone lactonase YvrE